MGINLVAWGLNLRRNDEVIITSHEHVGGALPWIRRAQLDGIKLRVFHPAKTAADNLAQIASLIGKKTKVIAVPHISCTTGCRFPLREIAAVAQREKLFFFVDGAHGPGSSLLQLNDWGVDAYAGSGHKWLCGPAGTGFLYIRENRLEEISPLQVGAYSDASWEISPDKYSMALKSDASRYFYGTQNNALFIGLEKSLDFFEAIGMAKVEDRINELNNLLFSGLQSIPEVEILSPVEKKSRGPMLTFKSRKMETAKLRKKLSADGFRVRQIYEANLDGIRISTHLLNNESEINRLLNALSS